MIRHCPYHHRMLACNADMVDRLGIAAPLRYSSVAEEHTATRTSVGIFDVYYQVAIEVCGPDAGAFLDYVCVNRVMSLANGTAVYTSLCNDGGGIIDDLTAFRIGEERYWLCPTPSRVDAVTAHLGKHIVGRRAWATNLGYKNAYLSLQGPNSRALLQGLTVTDVSRESLPYFRLTLADVADVPGVLISRTGFSGELGFELFYPSEYAEHMWDAVFAAGKAFDAKPCGLGALRTLRMEKRFPIFGLELDETTSPLEAGLGWTVKFQKGEFIGRSALLEQKRRGIPRRLVLLEIDGFDTGLAIGDKIDAGGGETASVRSVDAGYTVGKTLVMAYLPTRCAVDGSSVALATTAGEL